MKRKLIHLLLAALVLFSAGCRYEAPLTENHTIPVDSSVLGLWEYVPAEDETPGTPEQMMVLQYSETEYLIHYPTGKDAMYFRGYLIRVGDVTCVQLQLLGTEDGPVDKDERKLFHVASYRLAADELVVRTLNTDLVADDLKDAAALRALFLKHQGSAELFADPGRFRKVQEKN
ncbi:MAG: hypothetical protein ACYC9M_05425 [Desulfobulbaceae bacterium]